MSLQISILTPASPFWNGQADEIIITTVTGEMSLLQNHASIVTSLGVGPMFIRTKNRWSAYAIMGGVAHFKKNQVLIFTNEAESAENIDPAEAQMSLYKAEASFNTAERGIPKVAATFAYMRAKARLRAVSIRRG